ncbi:MAG: MFS transporter [Pirellulales bacterium]
MVDDVREPSKGSLLVIFLTVFVDLLGFGIVLPLLPIYAQQFSTGESGWQIGLLMASFSAMQFLFSPVWGRLSDQIGRRPVLMIGLAGSVAFYALFGWAMVQKSLTLVYIARIGAGIAGATISTAQAYIADCTTRHNRSRGMALIGMAFGLGFTLGPLIGSLAVSGGSGEPGAPLPDPGPWPGYVAAILSAVALILAAMLLPESRWNQSNLVGQEDEGVVKGERHAIWSFGELRRAMRIPTVPSLLVTIFICIFSFASFETTISMIVSGRSRVVQGFEFSDRGVFLVFAFIGLILALVQGGLVRRLAGRVPDTSLALAGGMIELVGFVLMMFAVRGTSIPMLLGALSIVVCGFAFVNPSLNGLLSRRTSADQQGGVLGVGQSIGSLARICGSALGPTLVARQPLAPFVVSLLLITCGLGLIWNQRRVVEPD